MWCGVSFSRLVARATDENKKSRRPSVHDWMVKLTTFRRVSPLHLIALRVNSYMYTVMRKQESGSASRVGPDGSHPFAVFLVGAGTSPSALLRLPLVEFTRNGHARHSSNTL
jgi:hypothetical protein